MDWLYKIDWEKAFALNTSLLEIFLRGTLTYLALFILLRLILKRQAGGQIGTTDLLILVLISDAAQNAMAGEYTSITDGVLLVGVIMFWSYALDWLHFHVPALRPLLRPSGLPLIIDGRLIRKNLRRELITDDELAAVLRRQGVSNLEEVRLAVLEADGSISVVQDETPPGNHEANRPRIG